MNSLIKQQGGILKSTQELRDSLVGVLADEDLAFRLPGSNITLGELCREMGEIERSYIDSFKLFKQDFSYHHADDGVVKSVGKLKSWYEALDRELTHALQELSEGDLERTIDRGHGFAPSAVTNFHIYREALLIFYAKAHIYLKALDKSVPGTWQWWIGDRADYENAG
jgi:hypothetical protein